MTARHALATLLALALLAAGIASLLRERRFWREFHRQAETHRRHLRAVV